MEFVIIWVVLVTIVLAFNYGEAHDIVAEIHFKDDQQVVGAWQCRKCKAVNG